MATDKGVVKGKTSTGFKYAVKKAMLKNAEFLEMFVALQNDDQTRTFEMIELALGKEQKKALYDHVRDEDGIVPIDALTSEVAEIFEKLGEDDEVKN